MLFRSIRGGGGANGEGMQGPTVANAAGMMGGGGVFSGYNPAPDAQAQPVMAAQAQPAVIHAAMAPQGQPAASPGFFSRMVQGLQFGLGYDPFNGTHVGATPQVGLSHPAKVIQYMNPQGFAASGQAIAAAGGGVFDGMAPDTGQRFAPVDLGAPTPDAPGATLADLMGPQGPTAAEFAQSAANMRTNGFSPEANARMDALSTVQSRVNAGMGGGTMAQEARGRTVRANQDAATVAAQNQANVMARGAQGIAGKQGLADAAGQTATDVAGIGADASVQREQAHAQAIVAAAEQSGNKAMALAGLRSAGLSQDTHMKVLAAMYSKAQTPEEQKAIGAEFAALMKPQEGAAAAPAGNTPAPVGYVHTRADGSKIKKQANGTWVPA